MLGRLLDRRYRIIQLLGSGGFSRTYIAEDTKMYNTRCVVKQLKPQTNEPKSLKLARRLFDAEAEILHKLGNYEQIPRLLAHFEENQEFYLVQQLILGHPLNQELSPGDKKNEDYVVNLLHNILQPLAFVHQNHVIHRDIKPSNLVRRDSDAKIVLIDFGAVKQISAQVATNSQTSTITVSIGTPGYMPSEQTQGSPRFSSDVYAVGMIGIQALTGFLPDDLPKDVHAEIIWRSLAKVKTELADVLDKMVRYDFRQRYDSATEALTAVEELANIYQITPQSHTKNYSPYPGNHLQITLHSAPPSVLPQYRQETLFPSDEMATVLAPHLRISWGFYLQWVFITCFGYIGGYLIGFNLLAKLGDWAAISFWGLAIGVKQWLVLRGKVFRTSWLWIFATALSVVVPFFLVGLNNYQSFALLHGLSVGIGQWLVLRRLVKKAGWWILINICGGWIGGIISGLVLVWLLQKPKFFSHR